MLLYTKFASPKVPKKRSRGGCTYCKEKKKKCDEERPVCGRCAERGSECAYEAVRPRQRRKRDSFASSSLLDGSLKSLDASQVPGESERDSDDSHDEEVPSSAWRPREAQHHGFHYDLDDAAVMSPLESTFETSSMTNFSTSDFAAASPMTSVLYDLIREPDEQEPGDPPGNELVRRHSMPGPTVPNQRAHFPDLAMIAPCPVGSPMLDFRLPAFSEFSSRPNRRALVDHFCNVLSHLIVFREESGNPFQQLVLPLTKRNSPVTNAVFALASAHLEYRGVENEEKSIYFHNQAIQGLAKQIEHGGTVDRNEVLAAIILLIYYEVLVQRGRSNIVDGHLKGALTIMCTNPEPSNPTGVFLERAFRFYDVIAALSNGSAPLSAAPATGCLLPVSPLGTQEASSMSNVDTLLGMATTLWPIIHRLSNMPSLKKELEAAIASGAASYKIAVLRAEFESTADAIETALGNWKPSLPPGVVYDESSLDSDLEKLDTDSTNLEDSAGDTANGGTRRLRSILHNSLAYRHSAFVYLYRTIYSWASSHPLVQRHAHLSLIHCVTTVSHGGPMGALLWPLFVAACEAATPTDRELAEKAFSAVEKRQGMMNIERAWDIVREVWRRADLEQGEEKNNDSAGARSETVTTPPDRGTAPATTTPGCRRREAGADLWRRVSADMGVHIVFG